MTLSNLYVCNMETLSPHFSVYIIMLSTQSHTNILQDDDIKTRIYRHIGT